MQLHFVADGDRDQHIVPELVRGILGRSFGSSFETWPRLHRGGFDRKLRFAVTDAADRNANGLVATVDADRDGRSRLKSLRDSRLELRHNANVFPIALGLSDPHVEAWLLDDPTAVREGLDLPPGHAVPNVRKVDYPKDVLTSLARGSPAAGLGDAECLKRIASHVQVVRCAHAGETEFGSFVKDVNEQVGKLV